MDQMFYLASSFNHNIEDWDTSRVESFQAMFDRTNFNQPLGRWNVSRGVWVNSIFYLAPEFNQDISSWDVSSAEWLSYLFYGATSFNQPLDSWNFSSAIISMESMFEGAMRFNQDLCAWGSVMGPNVIVLDMFRNTACPEEADPDLSKTPPGPFCFPCI